MRTSLSLEIESTTNLHSTTMFVDKRDHYRCQLNVLSILNDERNDIEERRRAIVILNS